MRIIFVLSLVVFVELSPAVEKSLSMPNPSIGDTEQSDAVGGDSLGAGEQPR
jgi:hypothetical protein